MPQTFKEINAKLDKLVESHLPYIWKDRDVRYLNSNLYKVIRSLADRLQIMDGRDLKYDLAYRGAFGIIYIKEKK